MGKWGGINKALTEIQDMKMNEANLDVARRRQDLLEDQFLESKKMSRLELLKLYGKSSKTNKASADTLSKTKQDLLNMKIPDNVASYIIKSGEAESILAVFNKNKGEGKLSSKWIPSLVKRVEGMLGDKNSPQAQAVAIAAALTSGEDMSKDGGQEASLMASIYAISDLDQFEEVDTMLTDWLANSKDKTESFYPGVGNLTTGATSAVSPTDYDNIRKRVMAELQPTFGSLFTKDIDGNLFINPTAFNTETGEQLRKIVSGATESVVNSTQGVDKLDFTPALKQAVDPIIAQGNKLTSSSTSNIDIPSLSFSGNGKPASSVDGLNNAFDIYNLDNERS
tara:strand:+ start:1479 stop:2492 length:1014 start_codon:yes stop_codon:yes gene_type:complete